jgi:hypothetical protein
MMDKKKACGLLLVGILLLAIIAMTTFARGATTSQHTNSLGAVQYQDNPNTYLAGSVTAVNFVGDPKNYGVVLRIQPIGTYSLFTEDVLFCGDPSDLFAGKIGPVLLVYETVAHHTVGGLGCHQLAIVHALAEEKIQ